MIIINYKIGRIAIIEESITDFGFSYSGTSDDVESLYKFYFSQNTETKKLAEPIYFYVSSKEEADLIFEKICAHIINGYQKLEIEPDESLIELAAYSEI